MNKYKLCPKCGKKLTFINSPKLPSAFYTHVYPLRSWDDLLNESECYYSENVAVNSEGVIIE